MRDLSACFHCGEGAAWGCAVCLFSTHIPASAFKPEESPLTPPPLPRTPLLPFQWCSCRTSGQPSNTKQRNHEEWRWGPPWCRFGFCATRRSREEYGSGARGRRGWGLLPCQRYSGPGCQHRQEAHGSRKRGQLVSHSCLPLGEGYLFGSAQQFQRPAAIVV